MLNILSLLVGAVALALGILAFLPLLGWAYWLIIPIALVGLALGVLCFRAAVARERRRGTLGHY